MGIEHRVFCHVARVIKGLFIKTFDALFDLIARTKTKTGLVVNVNKIDTDYQIGKRGKEEDWVEFIAFAKVLPQWNYSCKPIG